MVGSIIQRLRRFDEQRRGFPGEHWLAAAAGMWFLKRGGLASKAIGGALLYRAASGRDGLRGLLGGGAAAGAAAGGQVLSGRLARSQGPSADAGSGLADSPWRDDAAPYGAAGRANIRNNAPAAGFPDFR